MIRFGMVRLGQAGHGEDSFELVAVTRMFWPGLAGRGQAWQGKDSVELVADFANCHGKERPGSARRG